MCFSRNFGSEAPAPVKRASFLDMPYEIRRYIEELLNASSRLCLDEALTPVRSPVGVELLYIFPYLAEKLQRYKDPKLSCSLESYELLQHILPSFPEEKPITLILNRSGGSSRGLLVELSQDDTLARVGTLVADCHYANEAELLSGLKKKFPHLKLSIRVDNPKYLHKTVDVLRDFVEHVVMTQHDLEVGIGILGGRAFLEQFPALKSMGLTNFWNPSVLKEWGPKVLSLVTELSGSPSEDQMDDFAEVMKMLPNLASFHLGRLSPGKVSVDTLMNIHGIVKKAGKLSCWKTVRAKLADEEGAKRVNRFYQLCQGEKDPKLIIASPSPAVFALLRDSDHCHFIRQNVLKMDYCPDACTGLARFGRSCPELDGWRLPNLQTSFPLLSQSRVVFDVDGVKHVLDGNANGPTVVCKPTDLLTIPDTTFPTITTLALKLSEIDGRQIVNNMKQKFPSLRTMVIMWYSRYDLCTGCLLDMKRLADVEDLEVLPMFAARGRGCIHPIEAIE